MKLNIHRIYIFILSLHNLEKSWTQHNIESQMASIMNKQRKFLTPMNKQRKLMTHLYVHWPEGGWGTFFQICYRHMWASHGFFWVGTGYSILYSVHSTPSPPPGP